MIKVQIIHHIAEVDPSDWNRLNHHDCPFLCYEFLHALETSQAVGKQFGWLPYYFLAYKNQQLVAALPLYLKDNSYGEFVFDYAWADAYQQAALDYYPKFVAAIPYTPVSSQRILSTLAVGDPERKQIYQTLMNQAITVSKKLHVSSLHFQFPLDNELALLQTDDMCLRMGVQFHWHNKNYQSFEHFLQHLSSAKRKKIKRDRSLVLKAGIDIQTIHGQEMTETLIMAATHFYQDTFDRKWGIATFSEDFFQQICQTMGERLVFFFAYQQNEPVACAICYRNQHTLYGRHWGCTQTFNGLHFELCYHQGIEYCIKHNLQSFEPGAQGEHKISRGFLPVKTWSTHWLAQPSFRSAIHQFCQHEQAAVEDYFDQLLSRSPYKN